MRSNLLRGALLLLLLASGACAGPDLGAIPFYCNTGSPRCPDGYVCVRANRFEICMAEELARRRGGLRERRSPDAGRARR